MIGIRRAVGVMALVAMNLAVQAAEIDFADADGKLAIKIDGKPFATYVYQDDQMRRPYFMHVHVPGGLQVTRNAPPRKGEDETDHAAMHPGLWLSFGDLSGNDYWRNKAKTVHRKFLTRPEKQQDQASFSVVNDYLDQKTDQVICQETCRYTIYVKPDGYLLDWQSEFEPKAGAIHFGDQEEMGLGVRVAALLNVKSKQGGRILDSQQRRDEKGVWGKQADWCDYGGTLDGRFAGVLLMSSSKNFGRSWHHVRDYGLMVANPFGRNAFTGETASRIPVPADKSLKLRFGILFHAHPSEKEFDPARNFADYERMIGEQP